MLELKRGYEPVIRDDGMRFLVERLWPRGLSKAKLHLDAWLTDVGPSTELRQWFSHDQEKRSRFAHGTFESSTHGPTHGDRSSQRPEATR